MHIHISYEHDAEEKLYKVKQEVSNMTIGILKKGDRVLNVTAEFIAVERSSGEVDIIPLLKEESTLRIDSENVVTIGYGDGVVQTKSGDVTITTF